METKAIISVLLTSLSWFFIPIQWYLLFTCFVVVADLYTGWRASKMPFISRGVRRTIDKISMYFLAIIIAHGFDLLYLPEGRLILSFAVSSLIVSTEMLSVYENIHRTTGTSLGALLKKFLGDGKP